MKFFFIILRVLKFDKEAPSSMFTYPSPTLLFLWLPPYPNLWGSKILKSNPPPIPERFSNAI